ncbi:MAG: (d)CMP kinase [Gammaproteobacteria bacterium]|nr:MAG: (d)CMP kinase [Gammaproteobacteria bacterium]
MAKTDPYVITIDGASGSGKGSLALQIARKLGFHLLDSGAIYRLAALSALRQEVDLSEEANVLAAIQDLDIRFEPGEELSIPFLDNEDVSAQIRQESTGSAASVIAAYAGVRRQLLGLQRACFKPPGLVADGRDMGTIVFPEAKFKLFLYAPVEIRALRRYKQLINMGMSANIDGLRTEISERDERDRNRTESPLVPASDALVVDSSLLDLEQVTDLVMSHIEEELQNQSL